MNSSSSKAVEARVLVCRVILFVVIGLGVWSVPATASADTPNCQFGGVTSDGTVRVAASAGEVHPPLFGLSLYQILGNKTRMIQVATLFMIVGIMFLMWGKSR